MKRTEWEESVTEIGFGLDDDVYAFVAARGFGPWYQRDAWNAIKDDAPSPYPFWDVYEYLDARFPTSPNAGRFSA